LIDALERNSIIFDFATNYYYDHSFASENDFAFSDADFEAFKQYAKNQNFTFQTKTEELLEQSINTDDSLLGPEVQEKYKDLLLAVNRGKITALDTYKNEIRKNLEDEIITRYFYRDGLYRYYLKHDDAILTAKELLADAAKYRSILK
jgi:carboxyl-terminal processing protease